MKISLITLPVRFTRMPPIDLAYLLAYLQELGHEVYVRDFNLELPVSNDCNSILWNQKKNQEDLFNKNKDMVLGWVQDVLDFRPDIIGISVWDSQTYFSLEFAKMVKERRQEVKIVFGGYRHENIDVIENKYLDCVVFGEGEITLAQIVESVDYDRPIPGCLRKVNGKILDGGWRKQIESPDSLPFPDYTHFNFNKYLCSTTYPILFNRGCNWNCSFCTSRKVWEHFYSRSAENIFAEIRQCLSMYPFIQYFQSCDHAMNSNMGLLSKLCDLIIEHNLKITSFSGYGQVNPHMLDRGLLKKLKRAGFSEWGIGIESGSDRVLASMKRPYTAHLAELVIKEMYNQGIVVCIDFIIGYPTETEEDFRQTLEFVSRVKSYVSNISVSPTCGIGHNDLGTNPKRYGIYMLDDWRDHWESHNSNFKIRERRYKIMMEHLFSLGISHRYSDSDREILSRNV